MNSKFSKILTIIVAVISVTGIALFINVSITDGCSRIYKRSRWTFNWFLIVLILCSSSYYFSHYLVRGLVKNPENLKKTLIRS